METLVATVLIVIIFILASMILNNLFSNSIKNNTGIIETQLSELQYFYEHGKLQLPYQETFKDWNIRINEFEENGKNFIEFEAIHSKTKKNVTRLYE